MDYTRKKVRKTSVMEHIITFLPGQLPGEEVFGIEMTGITYPDSHYHIVRENSLIYCLEYVMEGTGVVQIGEEIYHPEKGDVYLLASGKYQDYRADPRHPWQKIWMNVRGTLCDTLVDGYGLRDVVLFKNCSIYPLFREFVQLCEKKEGSKTELAKRTSLLFHEILLNLAAHEAAGGSQEKPLPETAVHIRKYVDEHIYEKLTIRQLSEAASLSPSQLTRVFRRAYGQTPYEYILSRKVDTACLLLRNTVLTVKEIAYRLQFSDEHYFSNLFRQRTGSPPGKYKEGR